MGVFRSRTSFYKPARGNEFLCNFSTSSIACYQMKQQNVLEGRCADIDFTQSVFDEKGRPALPNILDIKNIAIFQSLIEWILDDKSGFGVVDYDKFRKFCQNINSLMCDLKNDGYSSI